MTFRSILVFTYIIFTIDCFSLSLEECINYAYAHRCELQKQDNAQNHYTKQHQYSKYKLLPNLQASAGHYFTKDNLYYSSLDGYVDDEAYQLGEMSLSSDLTLFDGLATINMIKQNKILIAKNESQTKAIQNTIKLEVIQAYYQVLMTKENIEVIKSSLSSTEERIDIVTIAVEAGKQSKIDLLELQAQREQERSRLINAEQRYQEAIITLKQAINYTEKVLTIDNVMPSFITNRINPDSIYIKAISFLPEFQLVEYDSLYWDYNLKRIKAGYLPFLSSTFSLSSNYQNNAIDLTADVPDKNYTFNQQLDDNFNQQIGLSLVIPLYSRHQVKHQVLENEREQKNVAIEKTQLYQDIYYEIEKLSNETNKRLDCINTLKKRLDYYTEIFEMRQEQYSHGILSITDYLIADNNVKNV